MWEIYGAAGHGIAVRSTVGQYRRAARFNVSEWHYHFGRVEYHADLASCPEITIDHSQGTIDAPGLAPSAGSNPTAFQAVGFQQFASLREWEDGRIQT
jgi:hypothetical protein